MSGWLRHHARSLLEAIRRLRATPFATALSLLMIATSAALPIGGYVLLQNARAVATQVAGDAQLSVFLAPDAGPADAERLGAKLREAPLAERVVFVPRDAALAAMKQNGALAPAISMLKDNPLPDAFIVHLRSSAPGAAEALAQGLRAEPRVATVLLDTTWLNRLDAILAFIGTGVFILAIVLALVLVTVVFGTIRSQLIGHVDEIAVARLVGATDRWIRRPFLYEGAALGFLGASGAIATVQVALAFLDRPVRELAALYGSEYSLTSLPLSFCSGILASGVLLGTIGALLGVNEFLRRAAIR